MKMYVNLACAALAVSVGACSTITGNSMQSLALTAKWADGAEVKDVKCTAKNDKGFWESSAPGFIVVHRSAEDLIVECKKEGYSDGLLRAISRAAGSMFGNILFGGGVGAIIDHTNGKGYNYPDDLPVRMGASTSVDRRDQAPKPSDQQKAADQAPVQASAAKP